MKTPLHDDELRLMRAVGTTEADLEMSEESFARGLAQFERTIEASAQLSPGPKPRARRFGRRGIFWAGAGVVAFGAAAGIVLVATPAPVLAPVLGPATPQASHAEAVELLQRAADEALAAAVPLQSGQYLRMSCEATGIASMSSANGFADGAPPTGLRRESSRQVTYVPADQEEEVVFHLSPTYDEEVIFGEYPGAMESSTFDGERPLSAGEYQEMRMSYGQYFAGIAVPEKPEDLERVALQQWRVGQSGAAEVPDTPGEQQLARALVPYVSTEAIPREIRAEAFRLLSLQPGLQWHGGDDVGMGFDVAEGDLQVVAFEVMEHAENQLFFDVSESRLVGERLVLTGMDANYPGMHAGDVTSQSSCTTSVVDAVPEIEEW